MLLRNIIIIGICIPVIIGVIDHAAVGHADHLSALDMTVCTLCRHIEHTIQQSGQAAEKENDRLQDKRLVMVPVYRVYRVWCRQIRVCRCGA